MDLVDLPKACQWVNCWNVIFAGILHSLMGICVHVLSKTISLLHVSQTCFLNLNLLCTYYFPYTLGLLVSIILDQLLICEVWKYLNQDCIILYRSCRLLNIFCRATPIYILSDDYSIFTNHHRLNWWPNHVLELSLIWGQCLFGIGALSTLAHQLYQYIHYNKSL